MSSLGVTTKDNGVCIVIGETGLDVVMDPDTAIEFAKEVVRKAGVARFQFDAELNTLLEGEN